MIKTLLLNDNYQIIAFVDERKAIKLIVKDKVNIISSWEGRKIHFSQGFIEHPATLRLKYHVSLHPTKLSFSRKLILRRDEYTCAYCRNRFDATQLTIDHVVPRSVGGQNSFHNCVAACLRCNLKKRNRTPEEAGMSLKIVPSVPNRYLCYFPNEIKWHNDWLFFI